MAENDSNSPYNDSEYTLKIEAQVVAKEIAYAVKSVEISNVLPSTNSLVYLNLETKDNQKYCVSLSDQGFRVSVVVFVFFLNSSFPRFIYVASIVIKFVPCLIDTLSVKVDTLEGLFLIIFNILSYLIKTVKLLSSFLSFRFIC